MPVGTQLEIRAQIDTEVVRALVLLNGGGAVALLALLPALLSHTDFKMLVVATLIGVEIMMIGLFAAVTHNRLRRVCSLIHEQNKMVPPKGRLLGIRLRQPTVCFLGELCMWISLFAFFGAASFVAIAGIVALA